MKKAILILFLTTTFFAGGCLTVLAHEASLPAHEALGLPEPGLLPDNFFYFFKEIGRGIKMFFTFDAVAKAELELNFTDEKLAELDKLARGETKAESLGQALQNYLDSHLRLQNRLEALKNKNKNVDELLDKLADRVVEHEELFEELEEKFDENMQKQTEESIAKIAQRALGLDEKKFKAKLKEKLRMTGRDVRDEDLEELEEIEDFEELFEELDEPEEGLEEELRGDNEEEADDQRKNKEDALKSCGPMPLRPIPAGCRGPICEDGEWEFICPESKEKPTQKCVIGGCSNELCVSSNDKPVVSICLFKSEFVCYQDAKCAIQTNGACGWTQTQELTSCIANAKKAVEDVIPPLPPPPPPPQPQPITVNARIENFSFNPAEIKITVGNSVTWNNQDGASHTVTSDTGEFSSPLISTNMSFNRTFTKKGVFTYHCSPHPSMTGKIIVE